MNGGDQDCRVLSIQSTVVCGYVGNKSATFPLQLLGFDVSAINSVQFSNHTGYGVFPGQRLDDKDVGDLFEGMRVNDLLHFSHVLTGYIGKVGFLEKVAENIAQMKKANPDLKFVCDPVMGDNGKFYVPEALLPVYRDQILPLATILTPNQFELEKLSGLTISSEEEAFVAIEALHQDKGVPTVVLSSSSLGTPSLLLCLASTVCNGKKKRYRMQIPLLKATFVGTGDLFAACLLAWMHKDDNLKDALEKTVATVQAVIKKTLDYAERAAGEGNKPGFKLMELRLVQCKRIIENPTPEVTIKAQDIS